VVSGPESQTGAGIGEAESNPEFLPENLRKAANEMTTMPGNSTGRIAPEVRSHACVRSSFGTVRW